MAFLGRADVPKARSWVRRWRSFKVPSRECAFEALRRTFCLCTHATPPTVATKVAYVGGRVRDGHACVRPELMITRSALRYDDAVRAESGAS
jgi:hypothetical protein